MSFAVDYLKEVVAICHLVPVQDVEHMVAHLVSLRNRKGRLFMVGGEVQFNRIESYPAGSNEFWDEGDALFVFEDDPYQIEAALIRKMVILGITRQAGYAKRFGTCVIVVPDVEVSRVEAHTNDFQIILCNLLSSHPGLRL